MGCGTGARKDRKAYSSFVSVFTSTALQRKPKADKSSLPMKNIWIVPPPGGVIGGVVK